MDLSVLVNMGLSIVYVAIGVVFCLIGYFILKAEKSYDLNEEFYNHNKAAGIMVAGLFIAIAIVMSGALA